MKAKIQKTGEEEYMYVQGMNTKDDYVRIAKISTVPGSEFSRIEKSFEVPYCLSRGNMEIEARKLALLAGLEDGLWVFEEFPDYSKEILEALADERLKDPEYLAWVTEVSPLERDWLGGYKPEDHRERDGSSREHLSIRGSVE